WTSNAMRSGSMRAPPDDVPKWTVSSLHRPMWTVNLHCGRLCDHAGMSALNPTAASLLGFLHHGPMTGWELSQTAMTVIGAFWSLTRSQVYRELLRMADDGLVEAGEPGPRDARPFSLTPAGRQAFLD